MIDLSLIPQVPYRGAAPAPRPITLGTLKGQAVTLRIDWVAYGASLFNPGRTVVVNLQGQSTAAALREIRSVYIDNMQSSTPVYVTFPDTGYTVVAQPNSTGWFKVYTKALSVWISGVGFAINESPITQVIVANADVEPSVDIELGQAIVLERASATISRGGTIYNRDYGPRALGDQSQQFTRFFNSATVVESNLWGSPYTGGFLYITAMDIKLNHIEADAGQQGSFNIVIESTGPAGILYTLPFLYKGNGVGVAPLEIAQLVGPLSALNLKLDATQEWRVRTENLINHPTAVISMISAFTTNPT